MWMSLNGNIFIIEEYVPSAENFVMIRILVISSLIRFMHLLSLQTSFRPDDLNNQYKRCNYF